VVAVAVDVGVGVAVAAGGCLHLGLVGWT
jgi:hypothetical protein